MSNHFTGPALRLYVNTTSPSDVILHTAGAKDRILVLAIHLYSAGAKTVDFKSGSTSLGNIEFAASTRCDMTYCPLGFFITATGENLVINQSAATQLTGVIVAQNVNVPG